MGLGIEGLGSEGMTGMLGDAVVGRPHDQVRESQIPVPDELDLHERNRIVNLAEELYVTQERKDKMVAHNIGVAIKLFREGGSVIEAGSGYVAKFLFLKLRRDFPAELAKALAR